jgi:hypothetical protein
LCSSVIAHFAALSPVVGARELTCRKPAARLGVLATEEGAKESAPMARPTRNSTLPDNMPKTPTRDPLDRPARKTALCQGSIISATQDETQLLP